MNLPDPERLNAATLVPIGWMWATFDHFAEAAAPVVPQIPFYLQFKLI